MFWFEKLFRSQFLWITAFVVGGILVFCDQSPSLWDGYIYTYIYINILIHHIEGDLTFL